MLGAVERSGSLLHTPPRLIAPWLGRKEMPCSCFTMWPPPALQPAGYEQASPRAFVGTIAVRRMACLAITGQAWKSRLHLDLVDWDGGGVAVFSVVVAGVEWVLPKCFLPLWAVLLGSLARESRPFLRRLCACPLVLLGRRVLHRSVRENRGVGGVWFLIPACSSQPVFSQSLSVSGLYVMAGWLPVLRRRK